MRGRKVWIILTIGFLVGIAVLLYPAFSNYWNSKTQSRAIVNYEAVLEYLEPEDYSAIFQAAYDYNDALRQLDFPLLDFEQVPGYYEALKIEGTNIIGYVKIDKIGVELPLYHGTSEEVLNQGVGHLEGSSLPVGGESTHSVMSAHRGLPSAKLFTDLDRLEMGDTFQIIILDQVLTYQVDQIKVITPKEFDDLKIVEGKDYCTLFTCTPYGINLVIFLLGLVRLVTDLANWSLYVIGMLAIALVFLLMHLGTGGNGLGMGDVKLVAAAGLLLGWPKMILAVLVGSLAGSVIHIIRMRRGAGRRLAFGPYLAAGIWFAALFGGQMITAYLSLFGL